MVQPGQGEVGGGSLPEVSLPTYLLNIRPVRGSLEALAHQLRTGKPAVLGYLKNNYYCLDVRTLLPGEEEQLLTAFANLAK